MSPASRAARRSRSRAASTSSGSERHESRRIDNQLRGRAGGQGDPGRTKFYLSLDDDLMRIFGSDRLEGMPAAPRPQGRRSDHPSVDQQGAQRSRRSKARNFDIRKNLLKYDDVQNDQHAR